MAQIDTLERLMVVVVSTDEGQPAPREQVEARLQLDEFVRTHGQDLTALAYTLCGSQDQAQDIVQEVLLRLSGRQLGTVENLNAYARRAVYNEVATFGRQVKLRRLRRTALVAEWERELRGQPDPHGRVEVLSTLTALPVRQRAAIVMRYYLALSDAEIAEVLACRPATVRTLLSRGLKSLRKDLADTAVRKDRS